MQRQHSRIYQIRPLDENICQTLGHVGYFTGTDTMATLSAMFRALATPPVNAVLWADAEQATDQNLLQSLRIWQRHNQYSDILFLPFRDNKTFFSRSHIKNGIADMFNGYAQEISSSSPQISIDTLGLLHAHVQNRINMFLEILPATYMNAHLRLEDCWGRAQAPHIDGSSNIARIQRTLRVLEPLNSEGTILCNNHDFIMHRTADDTVWPEPERLHAVLPVAYQAPANSLLIISNHLHHSAPIVHCAPDADPARPDSLQRAVLCYDIALPQNWYNQLKPL